MHIHLGIGIFLIKWVYIASLVETIIKELVNSLKNDKKKIKIKILKK